MYLAGTDAIILDTVGAAGDADVLVGLLATRQLKENVSIFSTGARDTLDIHP